MSATPTYGSQQYPIRRWELLIPVSMEVLALQGIGDFLCRVNQVQRYRDDLLIRSIIPTF